MGCSLCLCNDDKHQAAWAALAAHESPSGMKRSILQAGGFITGMGLQKTRMLRLSGSHTLMFKEGR